ncbi:DUF87 domain-containing protein [archaeon]|nr:DUF87 domain-containing protein [archaeon]
MSREDRPKRNSSARAIAKREIKKDNFEKKTLTFLLFLTAISLSILFLFLISQGGLEGYATYSVNASAGSIAELTIYEKFDTIFWAGAYGLALRVSDFTEQLHDDYSYGEIVRQDLFFDCIQSDAIGGKEIYASTSPVIDFDNLNPANLNALDIYVGCSDAIYCPSVTFTERGNIVVGSRNITNVPMTYTYKWDGDNEIYDTYVLNDGTNFVYAAHIQDVQKSFDVEKIVNYQLLLPIPSESTEHFYFFTDPNDECPASSGIGENILATLYGYIFDNSGNPLENVTVNVAGINTTTSSTGQYSLNFTVVEGTYNVFVKKTGYDDYFTNISVNFTNYLIQKNITMTPYTPGLDELIGVNVYGTVKTELGAPVLDARVILGESTVYTNTTGEYSINATLTSGEHSLVVLKEQYNNYHNSFNFSVGGESILHNIILHDSTIDYQFETGPYTEEPISQQIVEEVIAKGEDYWVSTKEINKEVRKDTFIEEEIGIYNLRQANMNLDFALSPNLKDFIKLDKLTASITPNSFTNLKVTIYGTPPLGTYEGTLTISGDLEQEIPVKIKVVDKKFSVEILLIGIDLFKNLVQPGNNLKYKLNLQNLLRDQSYEVKFNAKIKDLSGENILYEENFSSEIENSLTLLREIPISENFTSGDYFLEITAEYLNLISSSTVSFVVSRPLYLYSFFGLPLWLIFSIISFLSFVSLNLLMYKRYKDKKKRYRIQVEYSTLPEPGPRVVKLGKIAESNHPAYYEIDKLTTHAIVAGATGMGKSISAQVVIEEALMQDICVMVFDPTAQWSGMLRKCDDKKMISFYPRFGLKPKDARAFKGNVRMIKDSKQKIDVNKFLAPGQIQIFSMNKLTPAEIDVFVANTIKQVFRSDPKESPNLKILLVFDEVHRLLPKFGGSGAGFLQIERACREFRKWGLGVMLISQVLNDFAGQIKANINTELQTRTLEEGDLERIKTKYGEEFLKSLVRAEVGVIMFQNADYNRGRPYFVNFRPILHSTRRLTDEELEKYNQFNDLVDEIEYQIEGLEKEKVDTFDLKMELKLIKDKIMSGSFSVVEIYLEGLKPRVQKEWEKLGKPLPKLKLELVDEEEMKAEEEKAKAEKAKVEVKEKVKAVEKKVLTKKE